MRKEKKQIHMTFMETQEHLAERFMDLFEGWWIRHQLKQHQADPNYLSWKEMLVLDPVGANPVPKTNLECWKELKVKGKPTTFVKKDFLKTLERFQEENPGFDFSGASFNGQVPDPKNFMGGVGYNGANY